MTSRPIVSVLMPTYDTARYLAEAVRSVLDQQYREFELLVIDDGSTDDTPGVMATINDPRIRYIRHEQNRGLVAVLNEGLDLARGKFIARMDADDVMVPERLMQQVRFLEDNPAIDVVAGLVETMNADGETTGVWDTDRATVEERAIRAMMPRTNCIAHPTVMMRTASLNGLRYRGRHEDWDLWLRLLSRGKRIVKLPQVLLRYRVHASSFMGSAKARTPLEKRLLLSRHEFLCNEWRSFHFHPVQWDVLRAQCRTFARHLRVNVLPGIARDLHRRITYSPLGILREQQALRAAERSWKGRTLLLIPYLHTGGAEQVHSDIVAAVADACPLVVVHGFSTDRMFEEVLRKHATVLELPRSLNHPDLRQNTLQRLANLLNVQQAPTVFGALSGAFFDLLPHLRADVPTYHLQHAFKYQPDGNVQHRAWLDHFNRVTGYLFISSRSQQEFARFLHANHLPASAASKLLLIPNAVHRFGKVHEHGKLGLVWVGRDSSEKRLPLFLQLADRLERAHPGAFRFTVVGPSKVNREPHVSSLGTVQDGERLASILAEHDVLVLTSDREGFPLVIMEAMAQGLAIASTPVGDVPVRLSKEEALITSTVEAQVVVEELAAAIAALALDRTLLQHMKHNALSKARSEFDPEQFNQRYRTLLIRP